MRKGTYLTKTARLIKFLKSAPPMSAGMIAAAVPLDHASVLSWMYVLRDHGLVECLNENPRKWKWKQ